MLLLVRMRLLAMLLLVCLRFVGCFDRLAVVDHALGCFDLLAVEDHDVAGLLMSAAVPGADPSCAALLLLLLGHEGSEGDEGGS